MHKYHQQHRSNILYHFHYTLKEQINHYMLHPRIQEALLILTESHNFCSISPYISICLHNLNGLLQIVLIMPMTIYHTITIAIVLCANTHYYSKWIHITPHIIRYFRFLLKSKKSISLNILFITKNISTPK